MWLEVVDRDFRRARPDKGSDGLLRRRPRRLSVGSAAPHWPSSGRNSQDLAALATTTLVDADVNGVDDRVLEVVPIPAIQPGSPAVVVPDLGMVFVGGDGGVAGIQVGAPEIVFIQADGSGERLD